MIMPWISCFNQAYLFFIQIIASCLTIFLMIFLIRILLVFQHFRYYCIDSFLRATVILYMLEYVHMHYQFGTEGGERYIAGYYEAVLRDKEAIGKLLLSVKPLNQLAFLSWGQVGCLQRIFVLRNA